jgi:hypothetical protein
MSLLILGRAGEKKIIANLGSEVEIRVLRIEADRVLLDVRSLSQPVMHGATTCEAVTANAGGKRHE